MHTRIAFIFLSLLTLDLDLWSLDSEENVLTYVLLSPDYTSKLLLYHNISVSCELCDTHPDATQSLVIMLVHHHGYQILFEQKY